MRRNTRFFSRKNERGSTILEVVVAMFILSALIVLPIREPRRPSQPPSLSAIGALPSAVTASTLAGDPITTVLTTAPGNGAPIGGLKVGTANGWFAARPSGTENVYKVYAESFLGEEHLGRLIEEAQGVVRAALAAAG